MSVENQVAIELSNEELDVVAGGASETTTCTTKYRPNGTPKLTTCTTTKTT